MQIGTESFETRRDRIVDHHRRLTERSNAIDPDYDGGWFNRWERPVLTAAHLPPHWRFDFDPVRNPFFLERLGINAVMNSGAIVDGGRILLVPRIEGCDRKSFFALAESTTGVDGFRFVGQPIRFAECDPAETNLYDMRLTRHEDGWIYGTFCVERKDPSAAPMDTVAAVAACGLVRTRDFEVWERLPDLKTPSPQQRNVVLHPESVGGRYLFYTRPMDGFIEAGSAGGIGYGFCDSMEAAEIKEERAFDGRVYHTVKEAKLGAGGVPLKTRAGWLHIAHGVRNCASGLRYVLYVILADLEDPTKVIARPGGYFLAPEKEERHGDVANVVFTNGVVARDDGTVYIYYGASDTRLNVATTTLDVLVDYALNTPEDAGRTMACVDQRRALIEGNDATVAALD